MKNLRKNNKKIYIYIWYSVCAIAWNPWSDDDDTFPILPLSPPPLPILLLKNMPTKYLYQLVYFFGIGALMHTCQAVVSRMQDFHVYPKHSR